VSNVVISVILTIIFGYLIVRFSRRDKMPSKNEILNNIVYRCDLKNFDIKLVKTKKVYNPSSSSSGGGGHHF